MPEQDRAKIEEQVNVFRVEKRKFDMEISKWDDNGKYNAPYYFENLQYMCAILCVH